MTPVFRNPFRPAIDPLGIEMSGHGDGWIGSLRWRSKELAPVHSFKPWEYTVMLDGIVHSQAYEFAWALHSNLRLEPSLRDTSRVHKLAVAACRETLVGRDLHRASESQSELHCQRKTLWRNNTQLYDVLEEAELLHDMVEFAYESSRISSDGSPVLETHIHRALVRRVYKDGFRGEHSRGVRDYKFSKLKWLTVQSADFHRLTTQVLKISLELTPSKVGGTTLLLRQGTLGVRGEFVSAAQAMDLQAISHNLMSRR